MSRCKKSKRVIKLSAFDQHGKPVKLIFYNFAKRVCIMAKGQRKAPAISQQEFVNRLLGIQTQVELEMNIQATNR